MSEICDPARRRTIDEMHALGVAVGSGNEEFCQAVATLWSPAASGFPDSDLATVLLRAFSLGRCDSRVSIGLLGFGQDTRSVSTRAFLDANPWHERAVELLRGEHVKRLAELRCSSTSEQELRDAGVELIGAFRHESRILGLVAFAGGDEMRVTGDDVALMNGLIALSSRVVYTAFLARELRVARHNALPISAMRATAHDAVKHLGLASGLAKRLAAQAGPGQSRDATRIASFLTIASEGLRRLARLGSGEHDPLEGRSVEDVALSAVRGVEQARGEGRVLQTVDCSLLGESVPEGFQNVLENLLDNALEASPRECQVRLSLTKNGAYVVATIHDTGSGMSALESNSATAEGFSRSKGSGRTGVGLSLARKLVEGFGGGLALQSRLGEGTTASCWIPLGPTAAFDSERGLGRVLDPAWSKPVA